MKPLLLAVLLATASSAYSAPYGGNIKDYRKPTNSECAKWFFKEWQLYTNHCTNGHGKIQKNKSIYMGGWK